jgi:hypothetical protein
MTTKKFYNVINAIIMKINIIYLQFYFILGWYTKSELHSHPCFNVNSFYIY